MNQNLFVQVPLVKRSFAQKLFGQQPDENSIIELNNLFATKGVKDVSLNDISEIESKYHINLSKEFPLNLEEFYSTYYNYCLKDQVLSVEELDDLKHIKQILSIDDGTIEMLQNKIGESIFRNSYVAAIADGELANEKETALDNLQKQLNLSEEIRSKISAESRTEYIDRRLKLMIANGRISPNEWDDFTVSAKNLKIDINVDDKSKMQLDKLKFYWLIENGKLPIVQVDINLQKGEDCYFSNAADWLEHRTVTKRINHGGPVFRVKIMKGLYYRVGSVKVQRITDDQVQVIDSGTIYLTNKRVIFVGAIKNSTIKIDKILSIVPYSDGVEIEKDTGKSPILRVKNDADILAMTLSRLIKDTH